MSLAVSRSTPAGVSEVQLSWVFLGASIDWPCTNTFKDGSGFRVNFEPQNITLLKVNVHPCRRRTVRGASPKAASIGPSVAAERPPSQPQLSQDLCSRASQATPGNCRIERQIWTFHSQILKILKR